MIGCAHPPPCSWPFSYLSPLWGLLCSDVPSNGSSSHLIGWWKITFSTPSPLYHSQHINIQFVNMNLRLYKESHEVKLTIFATYSFLLCVNRGWREGSVTCAVQSGGPEFRSQNPNNKLGVVVPSVPSVLGSGGRKQ